MKKKISTKTILTSLAVLGLSALVYLWYQGSCLKNHSEKFKKLGDPMITTVLAFYKENQRYPSHKESQAIFNKMGCINIIQKRYKESKNLKGEVYKKSASYDCEYKTRIYHFSLSTSDSSVKRREYTSAYDIGFSKGNTRCFTSFLSDGRVGREDLACYQDSCINLSH